MKGRALLLILMFVCGSIPAFADTRVVNTQTLRDLRVGDSVTLPDGRVLTIQSITPAANGALDFGYSGGNRQVFSDPTRTLESAFGTSSTTSRPDTPPPAPTPPPPAPGTGPSPPPPSPTPSPTRAPINTAGDLQVGDSIVYPDGRRVTISRITPQPDGTLAIRFADNSLISLTPVDTLDAMGNGVRATAGTAAPAPPPAPPPGSTTPPPPPTPAPATSTGDVTTLRSQDFSLLGSDPGVATAQRELEQQQAQARAALDQARASNPSLPTVDQLLAARGLQVTGTSSQALTQLLRDSPAVVAALTLLTRAEDRYREVARSSINTQRQTINTRITATRDQIRGELNYNTAQEQTAQSRSQVQITINELRDTHPDLPTFEDLMRVRAGEPVPGLDNARYNQILRDNPTILSTLSAFTDKEDALRELETQIARDPRLVEAQGQLEQIGTLETTLRTFRSSMLSVPSSQLPSPTIPRAPTAPPAPATAPPGLQPITGTPITAAQRLGITHERFVQIDAGLAEIETKTADIERLEAQIATLADGPQKTAIRTQIQALERLIGEKLLSLTSGDSGGLVTSISNMRQGNRVLYDRILSAEGTFAAGLFYDPERHQYFSVGSDDTNSVTNAPSVIEQGGKTFSIARDYVGLIYSPTGNLVNPRTGSDFAPGDRIPIVDSTNGDELTGRYLTTASGNPDSTQSGLGIVEVDTGFLGALFRSPKLIIGGVQNGQVVSANPADYDEDKVEGVRAGFEQQATDMENYLRYVQLQRKEIDGQLTPSENDELRGIALTQETQARLRTMADQTRGQLTNQLAHILSIIGSERDLSDIADQSTFGRDPAFPGLSQADLDLLSKLVGPNGQLPDELMITPPTNYDPNNAEQRAALNAQIQTAIEALIASGKLDEVSAAETLKQLQKAEREADLSTDRNTIGLKQTFGALALMRYLGQVHSQYGGIGRFASLFIDDKDMLGIKDEVHQSFCDSVLFGDPSCRAQAFCEITPDHMAGGNVIIGKVNPQFEAAAHLEAFVYPPVFVENATAARRFKAERLYQVTFSVSVPGEDSNSYNVVFRGPTRTSKLFTSSQPLGESGSARRDRKNPFLRYSSEIYDSACIEFTKKITDFTGAKHKDLCVPIILKSGTAPSRVQESADERAGSSQRGESGDF